MNRSARILALAGLVALAAGRAEAAFLSGDRLLTACKSGNAADHALCSAYLVGAADTLATIQRFTSLRRQACLPPGVTSNALINALLAHAAQSPGDAKGTGADLVYTALATSFPCHG